MAQIIGRKLDPKPVLTWLDIAEWSVILTIFALMLFFLHLIIAPFKYHACSDKATELHKAMYVAFDNSCNIVDKDNKK